MSHHLAGITLTALVLGVVLPALGQPPPPPSGHSVSAAEVVKMAIEHSPELAAAVAETQRATLEVQSEEGRYTPLFTASAGWLHRETPSLRTGGIDVAGSDDIALAAGIAHTFAWGTSVAAELTLNGAGRDFIQPDSASVLRLGPTYGVGVRVQVDQPLLRGLGRELGEANLRRARTARSAAVLARQEAASEVVQTVLGAYWELWYQQAAVVIQRRALKVAERQLKDAGIRLKAGAVASYDVLPLRTEVASIREALSAATGNLRQRQLALAQPIGHPLAAAAGDLVAAEPTPTMSGRQWNESTVVEAATANGYSIALQQAAVAQARIDASVAGDATRTQLDLSAWLALDGLGDRAPGDALAMLGSAEAVSGYIGLSLELPFDSTARDNDAARARLAVQVEQSKLQAAIEQTVGSALQSLEAVQTAQRRVSFAEETAAIAGESAAGQRVRFNAGIATATELVVAEQQRRQAELRVARAQTDLAVAVIALEHGVGGLLDVVATETR